MNNEEEVQKRVESGISPQTRDEVAYQLIFEVLGKKTETALSAGFADRVVMHLEKKAESKRTVLEVLLAVAGGLFILAGLAFSVVATGFKPDFGFLSAVSNYKGIFAFGIVFVFILNLINKKITRKKEAF